MKAIRKLVKFVLWTFAVLILAVALLPLWIGPVVKTVANWKVPKITGTEFNLGEFALNQYTGKLHVGDMRLQNPRRFFTESEKSAKKIGEVSGDGLLDTALAHAANGAAIVGDAVKTAGDFISSSETNAVSFKAVDVDFSTLSALTDTVKIKEIKIDGLYFYGDATFSNIREIAKNASGGDKKEKPKADDAKKEEKSAGEGGKKVVVDRVFITGTKIQWGHVAVPLPDIEILDIGKEGGGADAEETENRIFKSICEAADKVCQGAGTALELAVNGADAVSGAVSGAVDAASGAFDKGTQAVSGAFDKGTEAVSGLLDKGAGAVSGGFDAVKGLVK